MYRENEDDESSLTNLVLHIILKALEDYYAYDEDNPVPEHPEAEDETYGAYISAKDFFFGCEFDTYYPIYLQFLGWDTDEFGIIEPERWISIIEANYSSIAEARPKLGLSTRLIPKESKLWEQIRSKRKR